MNFVKPAALLLLFALLTFAPSARPSEARSQARAAGAAVTPCDVNAYVLDQDPKGLNVRSGPSSSFKVVGLLPHEGVEGVGVHITASSGEWVRIDRADEQGGDTDRTLFNGAGWVYGPLLGTDGVGWIQGGTPIYKEPSKKSRVVARMLAGAEGATVRGCRGKWMLIEHKNVRGWAEGSTLCDNSLTTCS
jgi:SH3-like domain-containing protein